MPVAGTFSAEFESSAGAGAFSAEFGALVAELTVAGCEEAVGFVVSTNCDPS